MNALPLYEKLSTQGIYVRYKGLLDGLLIISKRFVYMWETGKSSPTLLKSKHQSNLGSI